MDNLILIPLLMLGLLVISGWFAGIETGLTNLTNVDVAGMRKRKEKNVDFVVKLMKDMRETLISILIGNNIVNILLSSLAALFADAIFKTAGVSIMVGILTFLIIVFGEIVPKTRAIIDNQRIVLKNARIIYYYKIIFKPMVFLFLHISGFFLKLIGIPVNQRQVLVTDECIKNLASLGQKEGLIKIIERDIIHKVFGFGDKECKSIMLPMKNVFYIKDGISFDKARSKMAEMGFTRVPVMKDKKVVGVLYSKDLIDLDDANIANLLRKPLSVLESSPITQVFARMKRSRIHMAVVRNKKHEHVGIVTLEDVLEELVGEIYDEHHGRKYK